jgi:hypothetical protein
VGGAQAAVTHDFFDHTSVLKLIQWRWGLEPLTRRDASHAPSDPGNLATVLNFSRPVTKVPKLPVLAAFTPTACGATTPSTEPAAIAPADYEPATVPEAGGHDSWTTLASSSLMDGWPTRPLGV